MGSQAKVPPRIVLRGKCAGWCLLGMVDECWSGEAIAALLPVQAARLERPTSVHDLERWAQMRGKVLRLAPSRRSAWLARDGDHHTQAMLLASWCDDAQATRALGAVSVATRASAWLAGDWRAAERSQEDETDDWSAGCADTHFYFEHWLRGGGDPDLGRMLGYYYRFGEGA